MATQITKFDSALLVLGAKLAFYPCVHTWKLLPLKKHTYLHTYVDTLKFGTSST